MNLSAAEGRVCLAWQINLCGRLHCSHVHLKRGIMDPALPPHSSYHIVSRPFLAKIIPSGMFLMEQKQGRVLPQMWAGVKPSSDVDLHQHSRRWRRWAKAAERSFVLWSTVWIVCLSVPQSLGVMGMGCRDLSRALNPAGALRQSSPGVSSGGLTLPFQGLLKTPQCS